MEILRADKILVGHDTFDSREDKLIADARLKFLQMALQVRLGCYENERVVLLDNTIQIAVEINLVGIEMYTGKIGWVVTQALEVVDTVVAPHIPTDMVGMTHHNLGNCRSPATTADNRYLTTVVHGSLNIGQ